MLVLLAMVAAAMAGACDPATTPSPIETIVLVPFAQHRVRLSGSDEVALAGETIACVVASYESTVVCYDPQGIEVAVLGVEGEGPGEFPKGGPGDVFGMAGGRVGAWSPKRRQLSLFRVDGVHIADLALSAPGLYAGGPVSFGSTGTEGGDRFWLTAVSPAGKLSFSTIRFDLATREIGGESRVPETLSVEGVESCEDKRRPGAIRSDGGGHYFSCRDVIIYLPDLEGDRAFSARMPTYREDFPTARDIANRRRAMRFLGSALADHVDEYRSTPKLFPALGESARAYDTHGRLWVGTRTTEAGDSSEVDLYDGAHYIGTVWIRDALLGLDLIDSIMVALVERPAAPSDGDGIPNLALDWYDISGVDLPGRKASQGRR